MPEGIGGDVAEIFSRRNFYLEHVDGQSCHVLEPGLETRLAADFEALAPLYRLFLSVRQGG